MPIRTPEERYTARPDMAHTSPVYVRVAGTRTFMEQDAQAILAIARYHAADVQNRGSFATDAQRAEAVAYFADAATRWEDLIAEHVGR